MRYLTQQTQANKKKRNIAIRARITKLLIFILNSQIDV